MTIRCFTHEKTECDVPGCLTAEGPVARARRLEEELKRLERRARNAEAEVTRGRQLLGQASDQIQAERQKVTALMFGPGLKFEADDSSEIIARLSELVEKLSAELKSARAAAATLVGLQSDTKTIE